MSEVTDNYRNIADNASTKGHLLLEIDLVGTGTTYASSKTLYLADTYITVEGVAYEGIVLDFGGMDIEMSLSEGISSISDYSIILQNTRLNFCEGDTKFSDLLDDYYFAGSICRVYQWFEELSDKDDALLIFQGVAKQPSFNLSEVRFDIEENSDVFIDIPTKIVTKNNYGDAPEESIGQPLPIVFGDDWWTDDMNESIVQTPCICTDNNLKTFYIAGHEIKTSGVGATGADIKIYLEDAKRYGIIVASNVSFTNDSDGARFTLNDNVYYNLYMFPRLKGGRYNSSVTDYSNAIDTDATTSISLSSEEKFFLKLDRLPSKGILEHGIIQLSIDVGTLTGTSPYGELKYYNENWDAGTGAYSTAVNITGDVNLDIKNTKTNSHGQRDDQGDEDDPWTFDELGAIEYGIEVGNGDTIELKAIFIYITNIPLVYSKLPAPQRRRRK